MIYSSLLGWNGEGNSNPLQYSCLEDPMDGGAWWAAVHRVAKSRTRLNASCGVDGTEVVEGLHMVQVITTRTRVIWYVTL